jgi:hypothetical protein
MTGLAVGVDLAPGVTTVVGPDGESAYTTAVASLGRKPLAGRAAVLAAERTGASLLTGFLESLPLDPADWPAHGWTARPDPAAATAEFLDALVGGPVEDRRVVVGVPDSWRTGRRARDRLRELRPDLELVSASVLAAAYAAAAAKPARPRLLLVCVLAAGAVDVSLCEIDSSGARLVDGESHPGPVGAAFIRRLLDDAYAGSGGWPPDAARLAALTEALADGVRRDAGRIAAVLGAAERDNRLGGARVLRLVEGQRSYRLRAAAVFAAAEPVTDLVQAAVAGLLSRRADLVQRRSLEYLPVGLPAAFPIIGRAAAGLAAGAGPALEPVPVDQPSLAVARGAACVAAGRVTATDRHTRDVVLLGRRVEGGALVEAGVTIGSAGTLLPESTAEPVLVQVGAGTPGTVRLELAPPGRLRYAVRLLVPPDLPPGSYRASVRLGFAGSDAVLLRPLDGSPEQVLSWEEIE